jgi:hypothetical protein
MAETIATIVSMAALVGASTGYLSRRIDRVEDHLDGRIERVEDRVERLSDAYLRHLEQHAR